MIQGGESLLGSWRDHGEGEDKGQIDVAENGAPHQPPLAVLQVIHRSGYIS